MRVYVRLADRLPPGDTRLAEHDAALGQVDHRKLAATTGRRTAISRDTERGYKRWLRFYQQWCAEEGYQTDFSFLTETLAEEYIHNLTVDTPTRRRYAPSSVAQALCALKYWADKHAVSPLPSFRPAQGVLQHYLDALINEDLICSRADRRVLPERQG